MADIIRFSKPTAADRAKGNTLCRRGFHKWVVANENPFDSKQGRLVTAFRCSRCGILRNSSH